MGPLLMPTCNPLFSSPNDIDDMAREGEWRIMFEGKNSRNCWDQLISPDSCYPINGGLRG